MTATPFAQDVRTARDACSGMATGRLGGNVAVGTDWTHSGSASVAGRFRSGTKYWKFACDKFSPETATSLADGGQYKLQAGFICATAPATSARKILDYGEAGDNVGSGPTTSSWLRYRQEFGPSQATKRN